MRIAVDSRALVGPATGVGRYLEGLLGSWIPLFPEDSFLLLSPKPIRVPDLLEGKVFDLSRASSLPGTAWLQVEAMPAAVRARADVFFAPLGIVPLLPGLPSVQTIHDLTPLLHPSWHRLANVLAFAPLIAASVRKADRVVTVSEATRREVLRAFPEAARKTTALPNGLTPLPDPAPAGAVPPEGTGRFVLFLSTIEPRKNVERVVAAMEASWDRDPGFPDLVLAGAPGWGVLRFPERIARSRHARRIRWLGHVEAPVVSRLVRNATVLAYPSLEEGFGFPALEAMSVGTVVVGSSAPALRELLGQEALLPDPTSTREISWALRQAVENEPYRARARATGLARAALHSWRTVVRGMRPLLVEAAAR